ncbi:MULTISPECIES: IclR family transcriptional regulator [Achromobacter]|uniref:IclR family transcriptional regulator n=1 Tax=Achromobacter denitrificans TaxID=32002 RepID=A0ABZ3G1R8_ACHDE|nr:IclR family transcriptional regulator [Achromobacter denitrificans]MPT39367.1 IclR family transcriptional regulator [Achromobacter sp.]ASC63866.1 IclR family transcriptional regulator [Achromobacter denitrificans]MDF3939806.1 IclR family transcriptional regulator [Achromobacter denitrificans]RSE89586.1 IclR family transcriptional regulator [Achromobacter denitrificans]CAB3811145.1 HTH-type transcriptional regulator XynR [Achromobacter denitrificans]
MKKRVISTQSPEPEAPPDSEGGRESGGVIAVARAMRLLEAFQLDDAFVSLAELSRRAGMHKTTTLRIARTLADARYLVQREDDGAWRLGPAAGWLGARYQASFDLNNEIEPTLRELTRETGESTSFFVREGDIRTCLVRVEGPKAIRHHIRMGEVLPLEKGSPGRVLLAFSGERGEPYESIRRAGFYISIGEREPEIASVSAPVFGANWRLLGALSVSGPAGRLPRAKLRKFAALVTQKASHLSYALSGGAQRHAPVRTQWHP